jgi:hypothetical protein
MNKQGDFTKTVGLRLYDAELIDKLNRRFGEGDIRYDSRNAFLTDLIEAGLERKERQDELLKQRTANDEAVIERIDRLSDRIAELEKHIGIIYANVCVNQEMLNSIYAVAKATNKGECLTSKDLEHGVFDIMPTRFWVMKKELISRYA